MESNWKASWIDPEGKFDPKKLQPVAYFRKGFDIPRKVIKARLYATAHGIYECFLNGKRVSDAYFTPGITAYQ